jgi:hypothetical protein
MPNLNGRDFDLGDSIVVIIIMYEGTFRLYPEANYGPNLDIYNGSYF